jgi:GT2 family glycosyltransferase
MNKVLSIIIPVWNKSHFTKTCIQDLSLLPADHEIILVDNGSTDDTETIFRNLKLKTTAPEFRYVRNITNLGFACACNIGYEEAIAPNVLFLNNDIKVRDHFTDWTSSLIEHCATSLVGPTMGQLNNELAFVKEANQELPGKSYMSGWCLASSKEIFKKLEIPRPLCIYDHIPAPQIFSEEFGKAYFEDTDLSFRARQLGIPFKVVNIPVVHFGKQTSSQLNTHKLYSEARQIFIKKWGKK